MGSWREGSGSPAKSKARGLKALGRRSVHGFVDRWVEGSGSKIGSWVRRSAKLKAHGSKIGSWVCRSVHGAKALGRWRSRRLVGRRLWVEDRFVGS